MTAGVLLLLLLQLLLQLPFSPLLLLLQISEVKFRLPHLSFLEKLIPEENKLMAAV